MTTETPPLDADAAGPAPSRWPGWGIATAQCVRFYSRLPVPALPGEADPHAVPDFRLMPRALPFAAMLIVLPALLVIAAAGLLDLPAGVAAVLVITTQVLTTGAFHEDGLADSCDGLFGGHTVERRLEIMKDSRIGTFGGCGLILALMLRTVLLAFLYEEAGWLAAAMALLAAAPVSRALGIWLLARLDPARAYGALAAVGKPTGQTAVIALALSLAIALGAAFAGGLPWTGIGLGLLLALGAAWLCGHLAHRLIGGPTGDIAGATQQLSEIGLLFGLVIALSAL
jgi:adenosylcobinamide-GDP ribazoletransferase